MIFMSVGFSLTISSSLCAQSGESPQAEVVLIKVFAPIFPPFARQALVAGDVQVKVLVRPDGTLAAAEAISGHDLLRDAALESARKSEFECRRCIGETFHILTYTFMFPKLPPMDPDPCCCSHPPSFRQPPIESLIEQSQDHITVIDGMKECICPDSCEAKEAEKRSKYRSFKCLYLWQCGHRQTWLQ